MFGNRVLQIGVHRAHETLMLLAESEVTVEPGGPPARGEPWEVVAMRVGDLRGGDALSVRPVAGSSPYVALERHGGALRALAEEAFTPHRPVVDGARDLCHLIYSTFEYDPAFTEVSTPLSAVLQARRGVCQDFAHLATGCLRSLGLSARYVSGYIETDPPPGRQRLIGADAGDRNAGAQVDERVAVHIGDDAAVGVGHVDRDAGGDATGHHGAATGGQFSGLGAGEARGDIALLFKPVLGRLSGHGVPFTLGW